MPEENSAAEEHAIMQSITAPLASLPDNAGSDVADVEFPIVLRGYDRLAVDAYVKRTSQLVADLQSTHSPEAAVRRALERVGEEVSGILQRAHEAAAQITAQSRSEAEDRLQMARQEADQITSGARQRITDLDAEADRIWAERQRIVEDTQALAQQLMAVAEAAANRFPAAEEAEVAEPVEDSLVGPPVGPALNGEEPEHEADPWAVPPEEDPWAIRAEGGHPAEPFDDDQTAIMPPIRPDEGQDA